MVIFRLAVLFLNALLLIVGVSYVLDVSNWKSFFENRPFDAFLVFLFLLLPLVNAALVILQAREIDEFNKDLQRARSRRMLAEMKEPFGAKKVDAPEESDGR